MTCAMRLVARMADDMGINIQVGRYSTVSINLSNILEFYLKGDHKKTSPPKI